ncbi:tRNA 2-thiouridine(34) synthase MnmA [bacterium]|nr:tRNA 2-thiouridine(34) synthase MnmA [bacterium]
MPSKRVIVGLSGGVDSAVAAALLQKEGYEIIGISLIMGSANLTGIKDNNQYSSPESLQLARSVAEKLNFPYYTYDCSEPFRREVIQPFIRAYRRATTPNPCLLCNPYFKWKALLSAAKKHNAFWVATGHYSRVIYDSQSQLFQLWRGRDPQKDQSYFLYRLNQKQLQHTIFPVGRYKKRDIIQLALKLNIPQSAAKESQDLCFLPDTSLKAFLKQELPPSLFKNGYILDTNGKILGQHEGLLNYTIGQRKGLGVSMGQPFYVISLNQKENTVIIGPESELYRKEFIIDKCSWISGEPPLSQFDCQVKIRYKHDAAPARLEPQGNSTCKIIFESPQKAITPGQSAVCYKDQILLGGGFIVPYSDY